MIIQIISKIINLKKLNKNYLKLYNKYINLLSNNLNEFK